MLASLEDSSQLEARRQCVPGEGGEGAMIDGSGVTSLVTACAYPVLAPPPSLNTLRTLAPMSACHEKNVLCCPRSIRLLITADHHC
jgi:hypothetical protein